MTRSRALLLPIAVATAMSCLIACRSENNYQKFVSELDAKTWGRRSCANVDLSRLKVSDDSGHQLDHSVLQTPLLAKLTVSLDGQPLAGTSPTTTQLAFRTVLAAKIKSKMEGAFLYLPWGKTNALVGGFAACYLPGDKNKILICGGDESPNRIRFAADKTWLVDLAAGSVCQGPDMNWPRKYPTLTALADGTILISGGSGGKIDDAESLADTGGLVKLPLELETYDSTSKLISRAGSLQVPRDETNVVLLDTGYVLIAGGDRPREGQAESLGEVLQPLTVELYDPAFHKSILLGHMKGLTAITWSAPVRQGQALFLGSHWGMTLGGEQLGQPAAELIDTTDRLK